MTEHNRKLEIIFNYCKSHRKNGPNTCLVTCPLARNCIEGIKVSRYNDPRFVNKCVAKVERAIKKEEEAAKVNPFKEIEND